MKLYQVSYHDGNDLVEALYPEAECDELDELDDLDTLLEGPEEGFLRTWTQRDVNKLKWESDMTKRFLAKPNPVGYIPIT